MRLPSRHDSQDELRRYVAEASGVPVERVGEVRWASDPARPDRQTLTARLVPEADSVSIDIVKTLR